MKNSENRKAFYNTTVPSDWTTPEFGTLFYFLKSFAFSREQLTNEKTIDEIRNIHYGDIHSTFKDKILDFGVEPSIPYLLDGLIAKESFNNVEFPALKDGDLIIADVSEDYDGVCASVEIKNLNGLKVVGGLHTFAVRAEEDKIVLGFRAYIMNHHQVIRELRRIATGISVFGVSKTNLSKVKIPLPPLPEQKAIAHILGLMDSAINSNNKLISQKELRKKWLMQNLLTGKKRLKGFSGEWAEFNYAKLLKIVKRPIVWNDEKLYKLISVRRRSGGIFFRDALYGHQIKVKDLRNVHEGDFLFSKMQILHGASAMVTKEFVGAKISGSYIAVVPHDKKLLNMEFFQWYSQLPYFYHQTYISSYGVHIEKMTFDFESFLSLGIKLPSKDEQTAIANVLQTVDKEIELLKAKSEKLKEQKKGLMQILLTGKKRLK